MSCANHRLSFSYPYPTEPCALSALTEAPPLLTMQVGLWGGKCLALFAGERGCLDFQGLLSSNIVSFSPTLFPLYLLLLLLLFSVYYAFSGLIHELTFSCSFFFTLCSFCGCIGRRIQDRNSLCSSGLSSTHSVDKVGLKLKDHPLFLLSVEIKRMCPHSPAVFIFSCAFRGISFNMII